MALLSDTFKSCLAASLASLALFSSLALFCSSSAWSAPDLNTALTFEQAKVLQDRENQNVFYLLPTSLGLAQVDDGGPHLFLSLTQYLGTNAREDSDVFELYASLRLRVVVNRADQQQRREVERQLASRFNRDIELRDLPLDQVDAQLISGASGETPIEQVRQFDQATEQTLSSSWTERDLVMSYSPDQAEIIERILLQGDTGLSLSYQLKSRAWRTGESELESSSSGFNNEGGVEDGVLEPLDELNSDDQQPTLQVVVADTLAIKLAPEYHESRLRRYFLDGALPASYPSLAVYYFDMRNGLAGDIFLRQVQVEAAGVAGGVTRFSAFFEASRSNDYAATVRFPYAANLSKPYRWRVIDVLQTGEMKTGPWVVGTDWNTVINASGPRDAARSNNSSVSTTTGDQP